MASRLKPGKLYKYNYIDGEVMWYYLILSEVPDSPFYHALFFEVFGESTCLTKVSAGGLVEVKKK